MAHALEAFAVGEQSDRVDALLLNLAETYTLFHRYLDSKFKKGADVATRRFRAR